MTLLLSITSPDFSVMVSDRLLSGGEVDPDANKVGVLECDDSRFVIGFTGVATLIDPTTKRRIFQAHQWIAEELGACCGPDHSGATIIHRFNDRFVRKWQLPLFKGRSLAVLFGGYAYPVRQIGCWRVATDHRVVLDLKSDTAAITAAGFLPAVTRELLRPLLSMATDRAPLGPTINKAVEIIREASNVMGQDGKPVIGRNCSSLCVPWDRTADPIFGYHVEAETPTTRFGNIIDCRSRTSGTHVFTDISHTRTAGGSEVWVRFKYEGPFSIEVGLPDAPPANRASRRKKRRRRGN